MLKSFFVCFGALLCFSQNLIGDPAKFFQVQKAPESSTPLVIFKVKDSLGQETVTKKITFLNASRDSLFISSDFFYKEMVKKRKKEFLKEKYHSPKEVVPPGGFYEITVCLKRLTGNCQAVLDISRPSGESASLGLRINEINFIPELVEGMRLKILL
jgi:hypothetical protein